MSVSESLLRREWHALRGPFVGVTLAHLLVIVTLVEWRDGDAHRPELLWGPILFAVGIVVDRVYLEHRRGTWLVLPISRGPHVSLRLVFYALLLFVHTLVGAMVYYGFIRASDAPGQPLPSPAAFVVEQVAWQVVIAFDVLALGWVASRQEKKWTSALWLGSAAVLAFGIHQLVHVSTFASVTTFLEGRGLDTLAALLMALFGWAIVRQESASIGRSVSLTHLGLRALGLTPLTMLVLLGSTLSFDLVEKMTHQGARRSDETYMLTDGEIVVLHVVENVGKTGHRHNGDVLFFPWSAREHEVGIVNWSYSMGSAFHPMRFPQFMAGDDWYLSQDRRRVLFFDHRGSHTQTFGRQIGCWGADGISRGDDCTPFSEDILEASTLLSLTPTGEQELSGNRLVTSNQVVDQDVHGELHERFRGQGVLSSILLNKDQSVIFTRELTHLVGRVTRTCPAIPPGVATLLEDGTLAVLRFKDLPLYSLLERVYSRFVTLESPAQGTVTFCDTQGALREESWPRSPASYQNGLHNKYWARSSIMFPFPSTTSGIVLFPWMLVPIVVLRVIGFLAMIFAWRTRGLLLALPGLVLGPAYFLAAAFVLADVSALVERVRQRMSTRTHPLATSG